MTGALDLRGRVQAIGGINEKIEGFFRLCKLKGLTGTQGVILPRTNVKDLALRQELIEAVEAGTFRLWAVGHIDEALSLLSPRPAGARSRVEGSEAVCFEEGSFNEAVRARLVSLSELARAFYSPRGARS